MEDVVLGDHFEVYLKQTLWVRYVLRSTIKHYTLVEYEMWVILFVALIESLFAMTYRVIVNKWYKIKQLTCKRIWFLSFSTCILMKRMLKDFISMQYFTTQPNCSLIVSDLPSNPIRYFMVQRSLSTGEVKWIVFRYDEISQPRVEALNRGTIRKQFYYSYAFCTPGILTTICLVQEHWFPESWTAMGKCSWDRGPDRQDRRVLHGHPEARVR